MLEKLLQPLIEQFGQIDPSIFVKAVAGVVSREMLKLLIERGPDAKFVAKYTAAGYDDSAVAELYKDVLTSALGE